MKTLLLVDVSALYWSSWHSSPDEPVNSAFEKTVARVHRLREGFDYVAVAVDSPPYARTTVYPAYKGNRDPHTMLSLEMFDRTKKRLVADGLLLLASPGAEADDILATATARAVADGLDVTVATCDKDMSVLVDDARHVALLNLTTGQRVDEAACRERFGVAPLLVPELLALMGDRSDNIPGVPGVGEKTGANLLKLHGPTAEDVIARADEIKTEKLRNAVLNSVDAIRLARQLVQLNADVPIKWEELYAERKPTPLTKGVADWTDAEFTEDEPVSDVAAKQPESEPETKSEPRQEAPPEEPRAKSVTTAIVRAPAEWSLALEPPSARDAWIVARKLFESRMFGNFGSPEAIFAIVLRGRALGLDAGTALASFHVVEGKPTMHAGLIIGLVLKSGRAEYFDLVETSSEKATWATKRKGARHETKLSWTIEDACAAGLVSRSQSGLGGFSGVSKSGRPSNWDKYRRTMLRWRAGVELARAVYPDVTMGLYTPDEVSDGQVIDGELEVA